MQLRGVGTIAFPVPYVVAGAIFLVLLGLALLGFVLMRPIDLTPMELVGDGELRPPLALLPPNADGSRIAFADREVSQGQFFRGSRTVTSAIAAQTGTQRACPVRLDPAMPVTCVTPVEAAFYAEELTRLTNEHRSASEPQLTSCYSVSDGTLVWTDRDCTGFRLPTLAEWRRASEAGRARPSDARQLCGYARIAGCPGSDGPGTPAGGHRPNAWYLYDMIGNVAELVYVEGERAGGGWVIAGGPWNDGAWDEGSSRPFNGRLSNVGFRIARRIPPAEQPSAETANLAR